MKFSGIIHDADHHQFRLEVNKSIAKIDYKNKDGKFLLVHSEVPKELRGQGAGKILVEKTTSLSRSKK